MNSQVSRRSFVAGSVAMAGASAVAARAALADEAEGAQGGSSASQAAASSTRPNPGEGHPTSIAPAGSDADPIAPVPAPAAWDEEADVVVVGSGMGGLTAALYAVEGGLTAIVVEKDAVTGGAGRHAANNHVNCGGTKAQAEAGYYWPTTDAEGNELAAFDARQAAIQFEIRTGQHSIDTKLLQRSIEQGAQWADWMQEQDGVKWKLGYTGPLAGMAFMDEDVADGKQNVVLGNNRTIDALEADVVANGGVIHTKTALTALVMEDGQVLGIQVSDADGERYIKAGKGVILCAGGFGCNLDMLEKYAPSAYMYATQGGPMPSHTGEAIRMGVGAGAAIAGFNSFCCWETGLDQYWGKGDGQYWHYLGQQGRMIASSPFVRFDARCQRLPIYSLAAPEYVGCPFSFAVETNAAAQMASADHTAYVVLDGDFKEYQARFAEMGAVSPWLTGTISEAGQTFVIQDWEADFEAYLKSGAVQQADTLEELAELEGLDPDALVEAVDRWNACVEAGEDTNLVPIPAALMTPVKNPPFYCIRTGGQIGKTLAGLRVNDYGQVLDTRGRVIPGLYAGFTTAGGYVGENLFMGQFGMVGPMGSVAMSGTGGFIAARAILGELEDYGY